MKKYDDVLTSSIAKVTASTRIDMDCCIC